MPLSPQIMNSPTSAGPPIDSRGIAPPAMSPARPMYWSVRRELWENRSIYLAPLGVAALLLVAFLIGTMALPQHRIGAVLALDPARRREAIDTPYDLAALLIMGTAFVVGVFYCLDALYGERRDRSILFWKSLPVSDLTTVLSKAFIPLVVLPLLCFAITVATQWMMLLISSAELLGSGLSVATLWTQLPLFRMWLVLLYHLLTVHALWYAPIYCWLLLVSGWARRAALLWAILPPLAICAAEKIAFNTTHFAAMLGYRLSGGAEAVATVRGTSVIDHMAHLTPGTFLSSPGLWIGLVFAGGFLAAAARLRRNRDPI